MRVDPNNPGRLFFHIFEAMGPAAIEAKTVPRLQTIFATVDLDGNGAFEHDAAFFAIMRIALAPGASAGLNHDHENLKSRFPDLWRE